MAKVRMSEIRAEAIRIIEKNPGGIRYAELARQLRASLPDASDGGIHGTIRVITDLYPDKVAKPSRGLFVPVGGGVPPPGEDGGNRKPREEAFYEPFAEYLMNDLGEVSVSVPLGGAGLGRRWGTPDVVGVYKPSFRDMIKFGIEIVSAEVKIDPSQPVVAFGQAITYRLFSSKTYIAMPKAIGEDDSARLESLCMLFGVGLVLFDPDPKQPDFSVRVRAQRFLPDMFYVNDFANRLKDSDGKAFEKLFG